MSFSPERPCARGRHPKLSAFLRKLMDNIPWSERAEVEESARFDAPPSGRFRVRNANGHTRIVGEDREDIQITALKTARAESTAAATAMLDDIRLVFIETLEGATLEVQTPRKWHRRGCANLCVRLPRAMHVAVFAENGRVDVEGIRGSVCAHSTNGSANVADVVGDIEVETTNAKVSCSSTCGRLSARSSNGKIQIEHHRGSVNASTSNGLIRAALDALDAGGVQLATSNGRIILDLPEETDADVDIRVDNGTIQNERCLCEGARESDGRMTGRLGHGGAPIKLRTSNGSISIH
ncbi:MAG TPA: DUF4097 family beta strand repeat-containing protein [Myxococcota bacterium]